MKLSILIAHLDSREYYFKRILSLLEYQLTSDVEIVVVSDNGEMSTGEKQQKLLEKAKGDYVCYVDEDDIIPAYYIAEILKAIESEPDCVAINGVVTLDEKEPHPFYHSITIDEWHTNDKGHFRHPNHINPVKRELALQAGFESLRQGADYGYSLRLKSLLKRETTIEKCMYYYLWKSPHMKGKISEQSV